MILSVADVASLTYENTFFDVVIAQQTHIYWDYLEKGLSESYRVLKSNGIFLITCEIDKIDYHLPEYKNAEAFRKLLKTIGFKNVKIIEENNGCVAKTKYMIT